MPGATGEGGAGCTWRSSTSRMHTGVYASPPLWRRVFVVQGGSGSRFRYARLPFGWSYSSAICQRLVLAVVRRVLSRRGIRGWVYLDDILLSARRKARLRKGFPRLQEGASTGWVHCEGQERDDPLGAHELYW